MTTKITLFFILFASVFYTSCAIKCPKDVEIGKLNLSANTLAFLPAAQKTQQMTFKNNLDSTLIFNNQNTNQDQRTEMIVEILCERGGFLDKTMQTVFYNTESHHYYYRSTNDLYSIAVDLQFNNNNYTGNRNDTLFYETFAVSSYGTGPKSSNGVVSVLTNMRGNDNNLSEGIVQSTNINRFVADTTFDGHQLSNVWVTPQGSERDIFIYYSQIKGVEAITLDDTTWWRQ
jgi:hypothetical protein